MDEDDADDAMIARAHGKADEDPIPDRHEREMKFRTGFRKIFGRQVYSPEIDRLVVCSWQCGLDAEMCILAMEKAARHGAQKPTELTCAIMDEWREAEVRTPAQAEEYQAEYDRQSGRHGLFGSGDVVEDYRDAEEARRRRREENRIAGIG